MISIIVPIYKEKNIYNFVYNFIKKLKKKKINIYEILLVNNGSDNFSLSQTSRITKKFWRCKQYIHKEANYGEAIKIGLKKCKGDIIAILECDFLSVQFLLNSKDLIGSKLKDLVIGSKTHSESVDQRGFLRVFLTYIFNKFLQNVINVKSSDTHGVKIISKKLKDLILKNCKSSGEMFQTEIVIMSEFLNVNIAEIPVKIYEKRSTEFSIYKRLFKYLLVMIQLYKIKNREYKII